MRKRKKPTFHYNIHHVKKHFHKHAHKVFHISHHFHHHLLHVGELIVITIITIFSGSIMFANLTGYSEHLYKNNSIEVSQALVEAMQNPGKSLKQGNIISIRTMDMNVENTFTKGYCTYGAARISPEFFPYIDTSTQQRTWGGNAVDRCKNAAETGYIIGTTPQQGALVIYDAGGRFGPYGHVGKVLHYDNSLKKIIVRDMAWIARGTMSDRWEDLTTAKIKCYIYNTKTITTPVPPAAPIIPTVNTGTTSLINHIDTRPSAPIPPLPPASSIPSIPDTTSSSISSPTPSTPKQETLHTQIPLTLEHLSDIAEHFITQNNITATLVTKSPLKVNEVTTLILQIKNKTTGEKYSGLLPFTFNILSTNNTFHPNLSSIKIIHNGELYLSILGQTAGKATIVITIDDIKIGEFSLEVK